MIDAATNISRFLPTNLQLLAQRQHEELLEQRQLVAELRADLGNLSQEYGELRRRAEALAQEHAQLQAQHAAALAMLDRRDRWRRLWRRLVA